MTTAYFIDKNKKTTPFLHTKTLKCSFQKQHYSTWENKDLFEIEKLLQNQKPHTYIISQVKGTSNQYYLSYVRLEDQEIIHTQISRNRNQWIYYNHSTFKGALNWVIKKLIHQKPDDPEPKPYQSGKR